MEQELSDSTLAKLLVVRSSLHGVTQNSIGCVQQLGTLFRDTALVRVTNTIGMAAAHQLAIGMPDFLRSRSDRNTKDLVVVKRRIKAVRAHLRTKPALSSTVSVILLLTVTRRALISALPPTRTVIGRVPTSINVLAQQKERADTPLTTPQRELMRLLPKTQVD